MRTGSARPWSVHGALVAVQVFFAVQYVAAKILLREIPPGAWALIRVVSAALLMLAVARVLGRRLPRSPTILGRLALYSVFGVVLNQWLFVEGLSRTTPAHSSILMASIPVATLLLAVLLGRERFTAAKLASLGLAIPGVWLVLQPWSESVGGASLTGDLLVLSNGLSYSLFLVWSKELLGRVDALGATAVLLAFGSLGMLLPGVPALAGFDPASVSPTTWIIGVWIVIFPTALAYLLSYWALARVESSRVAFFIYLQPLLATALSVALFGERLNAPILGGAALIFLAVYVALRRAPR
jgi:drug/metabolite transporter (DMT)-like permease